MSHNLPPYNPYQIQPVYPDRRDPQQVRQRVYPAGVAMLVVGLIGAFFMTCYLGFSLFAVFGGLVKLPQNPNGPQAVGFWVGAALPHLVYLFNVLANMLIAYAGYNMMNGRNYLFCVVGAIAALIPCTSACCVFGIPCGIWGLVVLTGEGAKDAFE